MYAIPWGRGSRFLRKVLGSEPPLTATVWRPKQVQIQPMISSFTSERSAELAVEAGASGVREAQSSVGAEVAPIAALASPAAPLEAPIPTVCPHCGGSGILRMGDQQFRT